MENNEILVDSLQCKCTIPRPIKYGIFDPPCYVCGICGKNLTDRIEKEQREIAYHPFDIGGIGK